MRWSYFNNRFFLLIISIGLIVRLSLAFLPGLTFDMDYWVNWSQRLQQVGFRNFYTPTERTDYMPGYLYILYILGNIKNLLHLDNSTYLYFLKLPGILAELILSSVVYLVLLKFKNLKVANFGLVLICLNPALIFNSAVWGQIDGLLTLFMLLAIYAISLNKQFLTALFFGTSIIIKLQASSIIPALSLYLFKSFPKISSLKIFLISLALVLFFSFPFFGNDVFFDLLNHVQRTAREYPYNSLSAYNLWGILGFWIEDSNRFLNIVYKSWGIFLYLTFWAIVIFSYMKKNLNIYTLSSLATLSFYFLPTRVHERYLYPALVFLLISSLISKSKILLTLFIILSLFHFLNLLHVYIKYNGHLFILPNYLNSLYQFLEGNIRLISLALMMLFILITILILKSNYVKKAF